MMRTRPVVIAFIAAALLTACGSENDLKHGERQEERPAGAGPVAPQTLAAPTDQVTGSWNMQGQSDGVGGVPESRWTAGVPRLLNEEGVEVLALQEAGSVPPHRSTWTDRVFPEPGITEHIMNIGDDPDPDIIHIYWADPGQQRNGLAIVSREVAQDAVQLPVSGNFNSRPMMGVQFASGWYFNAHAHPNRSGAPNDAEDIIETARQFMSRRPGEEWMVLADFNYRPERMPPSLQAHIIATDQPTHQGGQELDFAYASSGNNATIDAERRGTDSDHWFVRYAATPNCGAQIGEADPSTNEDHQGCDHPVPGDSYRFFPRHLDNAVLANRRSDDEVTTVSVPAPTGDLSEAIQVRFGIEPGLYELAFSYGWCLSRDLNGATTVTTSACDQHAPMTQWEFKDGQIFTPGLGASLQPSLNEVGGHIVTAPSFYQWRLEPFTHPQFDDAWGEPPARVPDPPENGPKDPDSEGTP